MTASPLWHNPKVGDELVTRNGVSVVTQVELFDNGKAKIRIESGATALILSGKQPISNWPHWRGMTKKEYRRPSARERLRRGSYSHKR